MSHNSDYHYDEFTSRYHRILGKCFYTDIDCIEFDKSFQEGINMEYKYESNTIKPVAFIDYKYVADTTTVALGKLDAYKALANCMIVQTPVFVVFGYLDIQFPVKCFFVKPENESAKGIFDQLGKSHSGAWMSVRDFSRFQHILRNKDWNENEQIKDRDIQHIKQLDCNAPLSNNMRLKDLPNKLPKDKGYGKYRVPPVAY